MKPILTIIIVLISTAAMAQQPDYSSKVKTIDSTIETLYAVISGEKGEARDWELFKYLFIPEAHLIPSGKNQEGKTGYRVMTPAQYVETSGAYLEENGFFEKEISRKTDRFGNIVQLFSTYESYHSEKDEKPFNRGINSIQLLYDGNRWWVLNIFWQAETTEFPIPANYLD
ncbi:hypothetical protein [Fulvivirga sedimenti]|uniref:Nuclear transport factor 2 family protein n=1 Tax=Fulvivirga sedimenti TaxID=2879465 RepID=A0A9X1KW22_9BACT|nr:hypothetical protein [Fulvivirga sedimenti]MCA6074285.1 hypothetical protein [Fulvivirga sedimenti]